MTNRQLQILADRIYKQLSEDKSFEELAEEKMKEFSPLLKKLSKLEEKHKIIKNEITSIENQLRKNISNKSYIYSFRDNDVKMHIKLALIPSIQTIEEELILAGSGNVEDLINTVIKKFIK